MKKIVLASVFLFVLCAGIVRADIISPQTEKHLEQLKKLPKEERLKRCQELGSFKIWNKYQWWALGCDELMMKRIDKKGEPNVPAPESQPPVEAATVGTGAQSIEKQPAEVFGVQVKPQIQPTQVKPAVPPQYQELVSQKVNTAHKMSRYLKIAKLVLILVTVASLLFIRRKRTK